MSLAAVAAAVAAAINLCLAVVAISRNRRITLYRTFAFISSCLFVWNFFYIFYITLKVRHGLVDQPLIAPVEVVSRIILFQRLNALGLVFLPTAVFHFTLALTENRRRGNLIILKMSYLLSLLFLVSLATPLFSASHTVYWSRAYASFLVPLLFYSLYLVLRKYRTSESPMERNRLRYLLSGGVIGVGGGITDLASVFGIGIPPLGNITNAFYSSIVAVAIIRHRLLDFHFVFNRILSFVIMILIFSGIFAFLIFLVGEPLQLIYLGVILAASLTLLVYQPLKQRVYAFTERLVLRGRYRYQAALRDFSAAITTIADEGELIRLFVEKVAESMGVWRASLALADREGKRWRIRYSLGMATESTEVVLKLADPLVQLLLREGKPLVKEEIQRELRLGNLSSHSRTELTGTSRSLQRIGADVSIPLRSRQGLMGILNLGPREDNGVYAGRDLELLTLLSDETALALENIRILEDMKRTDRLRALGQMAASVAHEVRNPLAAIRSSAQSLQDERQDSELAGIIVDEVDRLNSLVSEFLDFSRPLQPKLEPSNITSSIEGALDLLEKEASLENTEVLKSFGTDLPLVLIDPDQMKQVFVNLFLNAAQAMPSGGALTVRVRVEDDRLEIRIGDSGCGIEPENLERIFEPFFTTKDRGSGLGLAIVRAIVEAHKGEIWAESSLGRGTTITVSLPLQG